MKTLSIACAFALMPMAARAQAAKPDTVKLGKYDLEITMESGTLVGELVVKRDARGYVATIRAGAMAPDVQSFKREGTTYVLTAGNAEHSIVYTFTFAGDSAHGNFKLGGGMAGSVAGLFKP